MKTCSFWSLCLLLCVGLSACDRVSSLSTSFRKATGWPYEVVVVMADKAWQGEPGEQLRQRLQASLPSLPQAEPTMRVTYVTPEQFGGLLKYTRNILRVSLDAQRFTKAGCQTATNEWAKGQCVLSLYAPDEATLTAYLRQHGEELVGQFLRAERERWIEALSEHFSSSVYRSMRDRFGCTLQVPEQLVVGKEADQFLWASNQSSRGRMDLLAYTFPYTTPEAFSESYLVAMRDSVLKRQVPGSFPGSYMQTERRFGLHYEPIQRQGAYCGVLRGLWRVEGDMMGGPFVSHAQLDPSGQRVLVVEGFVYAPESNKANLIRRLEAALYTLRFQQAEE